MAMQDARLFALSLICLVDKTVLHIASYIAVRSLQPDTFSNFTAPDLHNAIKLRVSTRQ